MGLPWTPVGRHWAPLVVPGAAFGPLWDALGRPWAPFGCPWGALGSLVAAFQKFLKLGTS